MRLRFETRAGEVSGLADGPSAASSVLVLGHGAGAGMESEFMSAVAAAVGRRGIRVIRFNFPFAEAGRKRPDPPPALEVCYRDVLGEVRAQTQGNVFAGGKSLGGRIASHLAAAGDPVAGLVFLGYPLHPPGRPDKLRDRHLYALETPMLFVEGTRDPFCPLETLERVRARLAAPNQVVVIDDGDHSFKVRKSSGRSTHEAWSEAAGAVARWVTERT
ncbi:MAG TPA: alpha/beta family hydrolase [Actinomycetota bacterium]|jgi:predicted alpha/beta-hydrolase family hydrolase|nr:alpha/beta family hydrolase [Actinomycetota bacterium]